MFFNFGRFFQQYALSSQLDPLLERKDITLEQILDEENIINEIKNQGATKFANYVIQNPEVYQRMINYIIDYDEDINEKKKIIKYQFLVSEIFASDNVSLIDYLFGKTRVDADPDVEKTDQDDSATENNETTQPQQTTHQQDETRDTLLPQLLGLLERDSISVTTAGYFSKTVQPLIRKRGYELWAFLVENPDIIGHLIKHLDLKHISEIVEKLILLNTQAELIDNQTYFNERWELMKRVINYMLSKQHCNEIVENICDILIEIVNRGRNAGDALQFMESIKTASLQIFQLGSRSQQPGPFTVLCSLVEYQLKEDQPNTQDEDTVNNEQDPPDYSDFLDIIPLITKALLQSSLQSGQFTSPSGSVVNPLGLAKIKLIKLVQLLLSVKNSGLNESFAKTKIFQTLIRLVNEQKSNNQLHLLFEKIVTQTVESDDNDLQKSLFQAGLLNFIAEQQSSQSVFGSKGILTKLSNFLLEQQSNENIKAALVQSLNFQIYIQSQLLRTNENEQNWLCGINPKKKASYEEDDTESDVQKILERFNCHKSKEAVEETQVVKEPIEQQQFYDDSDEETDQGEEEPVKDEYLVNQFWKPHKSQKDIDRILSEYD